MSTSHAAARTSEKPTFAQLKELMDQIDSGRTTKDSLQEFLRGGISKLSPDKRELLELVAENVAIWQKHFPGHEVALASRMMHLLNWKKPLKLRRPDSDRWKVFERSIFWVNFNGVRLVDRHYLNRDLLRVPIEDSFAQSVVGEFKIDYADRLEAAGSLCFDDLGIGVMFTLPGDAATDKEWFAWKIKGVVAQTSYHWINRHGPRGSTLQSLLNDNLEHTLQVVGTLLILNKHIEDAYTLLEMWGSGNYPIGFDQENQLVVLCG